MSLQTQLVEEMKQALKSGNRVKLDVIRFLRAEIKNWEIDHGPQDDEGVLKIVARQVKQVKESIDEYAKGKRADLVQAERAKLAVLETYLPSQMSEEELRQIVDDVIAASGVKQLGPVIGQVMARVQGRAEGSRVSALVKAALQS